MATKAKADQLGFASNQTAVKSNAGNLADAIGKGPDASYQQFAQQQAQTKQVKQKTQPKPVAPKKQSFLHRIIKGVANTGISAVKDTVDAAKTVGDAGAMLTGADKEVEKTKQKAADFAGNEPQKLHDLYKTGKINQKQLTEGLQKTGKLDKELSGQSAERIKESNPKRIIGAAAELGSLGVAPEAKGVKELGEAGLKEGGKVLAKKSATFAGAGAVGSAGSTLKNNPDASVKEVAKSAGEGAIVGAALPLVGAGISKRVKSVADKAETTPKSVAKPIPSRSEKYVAESGPIPEHEAVLKLYRLGYDPGDAHAILNDSLHDQAHPSAGEHYDDQSIKQAATDFDKVKQHDVLNPREVSHETPTEGTGLNPLESLNENPDQATSKLASRTMDEGYRQKMVTKLETESEDLPTHNVANMEEQAQYAHDLVQKDPQEALDMVNGKKATPGHVLPQAIYNELVEHSKTLGGDEGGQMIKAIANSKHVSNLSVMAQNLRTAAELDAHDPATLLNDVATTRAQAAERRLGKGKVATTTKSDLRAIRAATPKITAKDWSSFVDELRCK